MIAIGIDPGLAHVGLAICIDGKWQTATISTRPGPLVERVHSIVAQTLPWLPYTPADIFVMEHMRIYRRAQQKGDQNVLLSIAVVEGALLRTVHSHCIFLPSAQEWKGQVPKKIHHQRILKRVAVTGSEHALDAVGLVLWGMEKKKWPLPERPQESSS